MIRRGSKNRKDEEEKSLGNRKLSISVLKTEASQ